DQPRYAFAAVYEGDVGSTVHGGSAAAPLIADGLKDGYKSQMLTSRSGGGAREQPEDRPAEPGPEEDASDSRRRKGDGRPSGRWRKSTRVYHIRSKIEPRYGHSSPSLANPAPSAFCST